MTLGSATDEIARSGELWGRSDFSNLRKQQETAFGYFGPYKFKMDKTGGAWEDVTTNSPKRTAQKVIDILSNSEMRLYIDVSDEERKKRKTVSLTEQAAIGFINASDRARLAVPSGRSTQDASVSYAVIEGGIVSSVFLSENEKGEVVPCIQDYDPLSCQWI